MGIVDDRWGLGAITKLAGQVGAGAILVWSGAVVAWLPVPGGGTLSLTSDQQTVLTILVVVVTINAVNFIDGLDGLAAGIVGIGAAAFFLYYYTLTKRLGLDEQTDPALASAILAGVCLGFLPHNFYPARIFMGDTGSMLLGLLLAYAPISSLASLDPNTLTNPSAYSGGTVNRFPEILPLLVPAIIMLIPYADLLLAVVRRTRAGRSPFSADKKHLQHRLLAIGHSHRASVLLMYLWAALFAGTVVLLSIIRTKLLILAIVTLGGVLVLLLASMPRLRWWNRRGQLRLATSLAGPVSAGGPVSSAACGGRCLPAAPVSSARRAGVRGRRRVPAAAGVSAQRRDRADRGASRDPEQRPGRGPAGDGEAGPDRPAGVDRGPECGSRWVPARRERRRGARGRRDRGSAEYRERRVREPAGARSRRVRGRRSTGRWARVTPGSEVRSTGVPVSTEARSTADAEYGSAGVRERGVRGRRSTGARSTGRQGPGTPGTTARSPGPLDRAGTATAWPVRQAWDARPARAAWDAPPGPADRAVATRPAGSGPCGSGPCGRRPAGSLGQTAPRAVPTWAVPIWAVPTWAVPIRAVLIRDRAGFGPMLIRAVLIWAVLIRAVLIRASADPGRLGLGPSEPCRLSRAMTPARRTPDPQAPDPAGPPDPARRRRPATTTASQDAGPPGASG